MKISVANRTIQIKSPKRQNIELEELKQNKQSKDSIVDKCLYCSVEYMYMYKAMTQQIELLKEISLIDS
jgi:hypothetical protein